MKYLAFDIETSKLAPDGDNLNAERPLGISCWAAAWQDDGGKISTLTGCGTDEHGNPTPQMTPMECVDLVQRLRGVAARGHFTILTWNGCGFDFDILAEESGLHSQCADLALHHVDMMLHFHCIKGFPVGLNAVARGMGLEGKTAGMDGAKAPQLWAEGRYDEVLRYVAQDVRTTLEVALAVEQRKTLCWIARSGKPNFCPLPRWLTVAEALRLPEPDVSWMREPVARERFTEWMIDRTEE